MTKSITEMTAEIITAQLAHRDMSSEEITEVLKSTFCTLKSLKDMEARKELQGAEAESPARLAEARPSTRREAPRAETAVAGAPLSEKEKPTPQAPSPPQMEPMDSIGEDKIVCLECGREFKQISHTHLKSHRLTPKEYRKKYHLPAKQPLTARSLSEKRKQKAIESGLGGRLKSLREAKQKG